MKKKLFALLSASLLVMSMSVTALAANSPASSNVAVQVTVNGDVNATSEAGQSITSSTLSSFTSSTGITSDVNATLGTSFVGDQVSALVKAANDGVDNALIATIVDIVVPAGTKSATITLTGLSSIKAGDSVTIFHYKSDGTVEKITPSKVEDGKVTFTMTSFSPVAVVKATGNSAAASSGSSTPAASNTAATTSPKTADANVAMLIALAAVMMGGSVVLFKKAKEF